MIALLTSGLLSLNIHYLAYKHSGRASAFNQGLTVKLFKVVRTKSII